jgi:DNA-binding response OmpR family regulator
LPPAARTAVIVDDSPDARELVELCLGRRGWRVIPLESAFGLSAVLNAERPDIVLVDVNMPAVGGDKVVETLRRGNFQHLHRCPLVLYSGLSESRLALLAQMSGAAGWIRKDVASDELARRVDELAREARVRT